MVVTVVTNGYTYHVIINVIIYDYINNVLIIRIL